MAVFDQSYFGKFLLGGKDAQNAAEWLATAPIVNREVGSVVYTALCNARGGVQADLTITRDDDDLFYIACGGSTLTQVLCFVGVGTAHMPSFDRTSGGYKRLCTIKDSTHGSKMLVTSFPFYRCRDHSAVHC